MKELPNCTTHGQEQRISQLVRTIIIQVRRNLIHFSLQKNTRKQAKVYSFTSFKLKSQQ